MHKPVLLNEVLFYLDPKPGENFIDCTLGEAGHTLAILKKNGPNGKMLGIERDLEIFGNTKYKILNTKYKDRVILVCDNFANLSNIVEKYNFHPVNGILLDLGLSSWHLEKSGRGFSFQRDEPLGMRFDPRGPLTAGEIINIKSENEIEKILKEFGEEKFARAIARNIAKERKIRPIKTTFQLVEIVRKSVPVWYQHQKKHFATRTFQALRIVVNSELDNLEKVLPQTIDVLIPGGRLAVISFHSLEDRIVKNFFNEQSGLEKIRILTKKPVQPARGEVIRNPKARSAKLRAAIKI